MTASSDTSPIPETAETQEQAPSTWLNALLGAAATVFLAFLPFSPILGGGVAGYLEGGDTATGGRVGALSGIIATIPLALLFVVFGGFFIIGAAGRGLVLLFFIGVVVAGFYTVALSVVGGVLGVYMKEEL